MGPWIAGGNGSRRPCASRGGRNPARAELLLGHAPHGRGRRHAARRVPKTSAHAFLAGGTAADLAISSNENTNGRLRQCFPKGADLSMYTREDLDRAAAELNSRLEGAWLGQPSRTPLQASGERIHLTCCDDLLNPPVRRGDAITVESNGGSGSLSYLDAVVCPADAVA